jgi:hypothetical protein
MFRRDADLSPSERHIPRGDDNCVCPLQKASGFKLHWGSRLITRQSFLFENHASNLPEATPFFRDYSGPYG